MFNLEVSDSKKLCLQPNYNATTRIKLITVKMKQIRLLLMSSKKVKLTIHYHKKKLILTN